MLRGVLLDAALARVRLKQAAWMDNTDIAYHLTLTLDGWSNSRMESIYSWNVIFPSRRVTLLRADDLSLTKHSGENLAGKGAASRLSLYHSSIMCKQVWCAGMIIKEIEKWGPDKFAAIVTDNAKNMVKTRRLVLQRFPHFIEVR